MSYGAFVQAAVNAQAMKGWQHRRRAREARFGQRDLNAYMEQLNTDMEAFDAWTVEDRKSGGKANLGQSFWGSWDSFMNDPAGTTSSGSATGWKDFYATTFPSVLPGQVNPALRAATDAYRAELARFYREAVGAGGEPPIDPPAVGPPIPPPPPPPNGPPPGPTPPPPPPRSNGPVPPSPPPKSNGQTTTKASTGVGVLFMLGGAALVVAGRRK